MSLRPLVSAPCPAAMLGALLAACSGSPPVKGADLGGLPSTISQSVFEGAPNPVIAPLRIQNRGSCPMLARALTSTAKGGPWLTVSPAAPTALSVPAGGEAELAVSINIAGL